MARCLITSHHRQVGLATLDLSTMHLKLMQVVEPSSSYVHVTTLLASIQPSHVLVVDSTQASSSGLNATIQQAYSHIPVPRAYFDDTKVRLRCYVLYVLQCVCVHTTNPTAGVCTVARVCVQHCRCVSVAAAAGAHLSIPGCGCCWCTAEVRYCLFHCACAAIDTPQQQQICHAAIQAHHIPQEHAPLYTTTL